VGFDEVDHLVIGQGPWSSRRQRNCDRRVHDRHAHPVLKRSRTPGGNPSGSIGMMMPETNCAPKLAHADEDFLSRVMVSHLQAHRDAMSGGALAAVAADDIDGEPLAGGVEEACDSAAFCCQPGCTYAHRWTYALVIALPRDAQRAAVHPRCPSARPARSR
jgi:hypothetical protein